MGIENWNKLCSSKPYHNPSKESKRGTTTFAIAKTRRIRFVFDRKYFPSVTADGTSNLKLISTLIRCFNSILQGVEKA